MADDQEKRTQKQPPEVPAEDLAFIKERLDHAVKMLAEAGERVEKIAPKYKRVLDDARMAAGEVGLLLQQTIGEEIGVQRILAPMPGVILRRERNVGDEVDEGDLILILDAMKMENPITSPSAGKILSLPYAEGQKAAKGAVIAAIAVPNQKPGGKLRQLR
jgi:biotin carboxyl carrier protein